MKTACFVTGSALAFTVASAVHAAPARPGTPRLGCDVAAIRAPADTTLTAAKPYTAPVSYCRFEGYVTTDNPGPNKVRFMVAVPEKWNGRFLFTVQGGAAGFIPDPTEPHLREGYAIASTDKGVVTSHILDFTFRGNPAMNLDWAHRGTHVASVASQAVARQYYGREKLYRYVMGCSGGGDGTLTEAEMYPDDYDGYIGGAMTTDWPYGTGLSWAVISQRVNKVTGAWISQEEYNRTHQALLAKYDGSDGAIDGLIWDPRVIKLDAGDREALNFLSDAQFGTLQTITSDVKNAAGTTLTPGYLLGNPKKWPTFLTGRTAPPWPNQQAYPAGFIVTDTSSKGQMGPGFSYLTDVDFTKLGETVPGMDGTKFDHHRLADLRDKGRKLILWTGAAEEAVPPKHILGYTDRASATFGAARLGFLRTFLIPGLHHCATGDNAPTDTVDKLLKASQRWVEQGVAPDFVILTNGVASNDAGTSGIPASMLPNAIDRSVLAPAPVPARRRTYRVCTFPTHSVFAGGVTNPKKLDVNDANNWVCAE